MPLWGKSTTDESKPKYLDRVNKNGLLEDCFAMSVDGFYATTNSRR